MTQNLLGSRASKGIQRTQGQFYGHGRIPGRLPKTVWKQRFDAQFEKRFKEWTKIASHLRALTEDGTIDETAYTKWRNVSIEKFLENPGLSDDKYKKWLSESSRDVEMIGSNDLNSDEKGEQHGNS